MHLCSRLLQLRYLKVLTPGLKLKGGHRYISSFSIQVILLVCFDLALVLGWGQGCGIIWCIEVLLAGLKHRNDKTLISLFLCHILTQ